MKFSIKTIIIMIFIGLFIGTGVFFSGCVLDKTPDSPVTEHPVYAPASTIAQPPSLFVDASPIRSSYLPGEKVEVEITFRNAGEDTVEIASFPPEINLNNPTSGIVHSFPHGCDSRTMEPGKSTVHIMKWDQCDFDGEKVDPGIYFVEISNISYNENGIKKTIFSEGVDIAQVIIEYPQGSIEGETFVNCSEKLDGYNVMFEKITFNSTVSKVYIALHSGDSSFFGATERSSGPVPAPTPPINLNPLGHYRIDNGPEKKFIRLGYRTGDDSVIFVWEFEPVPADAEDLYFVITRLGDWEGFCETNVHIDDSEINPLSCS